MTIPAVSVTMAVCNVEGFLAEAIESVLGQALADLELIVVDFGSSDGTIAIISRFAAGDDRVKLHQIPSCTLVEARNVACSHAKGRYIAVMDADDVCLPDRLRLEVDFLEKNPEVGLVGGATDWIDAHGRSLGLHDFPADDAAIRQALQTRFPFCHPTILIRRDVFTAIGGYRRPFVFAHDYDLGVRVSERSRCANLPQVVLKYRIHPNQVSMRKQQQQTLCRLAAQASVEFRSSGKADPLDIADQVTPATLVALGVPEARQQSVLVSDGRNWIRSMVAAGEYSAALDAIAASNMLQSNVEPWQIADLYLTVAKLHWKQRELGQAAVALAHAFVKRPLIAARPFKALLSRAD